MMKTLLKRTFFIEKKGKMWARPHNLKNLVQSTKLIFVRINKSNIKIRAAEEQI